MTKILGCWYSNNGINQKIIQSSLGSIQKALMNSNVANASVVTCNCSPVKTNPFKEYITKYPMGVHLGIILQILRVVYEEERAGNKYDVISFLEHDVLYPHDYFDRVAQVFSNNKVSVISNMDYIGMNQTGWLEVTCRQEPMHQLSFEYNYAIEHFNTIVKSAILDGNVMLEGEKPNKIQIPYVGKNPSCHMNHSRHFTSHFNCYAKDSNGVVDHPYWGHYRQYYPDGEHQMR